MSQYQPYQGLHGDRTNSDFVKPRESLRKPVRRVKSGINHWFELLFLRYEVPFYVTAFCVYRHLNRHNGIVPSRVKKCLFEVATQLSVKKYTSVIRTFTLFQPIKLYFSHIACFLCDLNVSAIKRPIDVICYVIFVVLRVLWRTEVR